MGGGGGDRGGGTNTRDAGTPSPSPAYHNVPWRLPHPPHSNETHFCGESTRNPLIFKRILGQKVPPSGGTPRICHFFGIRFPEWNRKQKRQLKNFVQGSNRPCKMTSCAQCDRIRSPYDSILPQRSYSPFSSRAGFTKTFRIGGGGNPNRRFLPKETSCSHNNRKCRFRKRCSGCGPYRVRGLEANPPRGWRGDARALCVRRAG